jgi:chemotaxis protein CheY-P-specific phosphatase CheC
MKKTIALAALSAVTLFPRLSPPPAKADSAQEDLIQEFRTVEAASVPDAIEQLYGKKAYMAHDMRSRVPTKFAEPAVAVELRKEENTDGSKAPARHAGYVR